MYLFYIYLPRYTNEFHRQSKSSRPFLLSLHVHTTSDIVYRRVLRPSLDQLSPNIKEILPSVFQLMSSESSCSWRPHIIRGASAPPRSCGFLAIPRELRDIIYNDLIASGHVAILQVSQQVHDEAKDRLYEQGICRLRCSCGPSLNYINVLNLPQISPKNIQNFNLEIFIEYRGKWARKVSPYTQPPIQGSGSCHVALFSQRDFTGYRLDPVYRLLESLSTFKLVTVRNHFIYVYHPLDRRNRTLVEPPHMLLLEWIATESSKTLGHPEWKSDTCTRVSCYTLPQPPINPYPNAPYLEFHPQKNKNS